MTNHPEQTTALADATAVVVRLRDAGYEALLAGGCVRDHLLGKEPADFDIATSARPDEIERLFKRTVAVGRAFGVVRVACRRRWFEVATFRADGAYADGRRPDSVTFGSAVDDAARRDFTINGLFLDPVTGEVIDHVGGRADIAAKIVRAIGDANLRLSEDALRLLRAVRFAAQPGFQLDPATREAVIRHRSRLAAVSPERVREELEKLSRGAASVRASGAAMLFSTGLLAEALPGLTNRIDPAAATSIVAACPTGGLPLFLAGLLGAACAADARPPVWRGFTAEVARRLRLSREETAVLAVLLGDRLRARGLPRATPARQVLCATRADAPALCELLAAEGGADAALAVFAAARARFPAGRPASLLDGHALAALGVPRGPALGHWTRRLALLQLAGRVTTADEARARVRTGPATG